MIKILFLAANPSDTTQLRLDQEIRSIDEKLRQSEFSNRFEIQQQWAVRVSDLQRCLLRHRPTIVHFSGHGSSSSEIILEDNNGNSKPVSERALSQLFSVLKDNIRCVVLNACHSEPQAKIIAKHIDCVIGMSKAISDSAAISFSASFYQALGYGRDIKTAFDLGTGQINLEGLSEQDIPKLLAIKSKPNKIFVFTESQSNDQSLKSKDNKHETKKSSKIKQRVSNVKNSSVYQAGRDVIIDQGEDTKRYTKHIVIALSIISVLVIMITLISTNSRLWQELFKPKSVMFHGQVMDKNGIGVSNADIVVQQEEGAEVRIGFSKTKPTGDFSFIVKAKPEATVWITVTKDGYIGFQGYKNLLDPKPIMFIKKTGGVK